VFSAIVFVQWLIFPCACQHLNTPTNPGSQYVTTRSQLPCIYKFVVKCWLYIIFFITVFCAIAIDDASKDSVKVFEKLTNLDKIEMEFVKMTKRIKETLVKNNLSVDDLIEQLCAISAVCNKKVPIFDDYVYKNVKSIDMLWKKLGTFWNIFDYDLLILVVDIAECAKAEEILDNFQARIDVSTFEDAGFVLHCKLCKEDEEQAWSWLRVKVNTEKCTFDIKERVKEIVSENFGLKKCSLCFKGIQAGCYEFVYLISKALMTHLTELKITGSTIAKFAANNIISLQIDDMILNVPCKIHVSVIELILLLRIW